MVGQKISHYKIIEKLGEGGMGVVYKAEDTKLERTVALKFLAPHLVSDQEIRKRFEREAKAAAALNHPNICHVYEIDEADGKTFIAMAFIEGQCLDEEIAAGPLKLNEALDIAYQIAQSLQAAHAKGIVHRDVKPANVMISGSGSRRQVTLMDFGLAQLTERSKLTRVDETMGTIAYMSPEQTMGAEVDHRADLWALGVVLYEMVSGQRPFKGHYDRAVIYSITAEEPEPLTSLRTGVPLELELLIGKCLAKAPDERYRHADELAGDLAVQRKRIDSGFSRTLQAQPSRVAPTPSSPANSTSRRLFERLTLAGAVLLAAVSAVLWLSGSVEVPASNRLVRFHYRVQGLEYPVISPDGTRIVYIAGPRQTLWIQDLAQEDPRELPGTANARRPFWAPDSRQVAFATDETLKKIDVEGAAATALCPLPAPVFFSGSWSPDGETLLFSAGRGLGASDSALYQTAAVGGKPNVVLPSDDSLMPRARDAYHLSIPGRQMVLLCAGGTPEVASQIFLFDLATGKGQPLDLHGQWPSYSPSGHILWQNTDSNRELWAVPFSLDRLETKGAAFPIAKHRNFATVSSDGTLVYPEQAEAGSKRLAIRDRRGATLREIGESAEDFGSLRVSPDGSQLATELFQDGSADIWLYNLSLNSRSRFRAEPANRYSPVWSPDGSQLVYRSSEVKGLGVASLTRKDEPLSLGSNWWPEDWSHDANLIVSNGPPFLSSLSSTFRPGGDLSRLELKEGGQTVETPFLATKFDERDARFHPQGKWVAYASTTTGRLEVYVCRFPDATDIRQVSRQGGDKPEWRADGKELYYKQDNKLMAVAVGDGMTFDEPRTLFTGNFDDFAALDGGKTFLMEERINHAVWVIRVVQNWYEAYRPRGE